MNIIPFFANKVPVREYVCVRVPFTVKKNRDNKVCVRVCNLRKPFELDLCLRPLMRRTSPGKSRVPL